MKNKMILISLFSIAFLCQIRGTISPGMDLLYQQYPMHSMSTISLLMTIPSMLVIPTTYASARWVNYKISYRHTCIFLNVCLLIGGVTPFFVSSLYLIIALRGIFGIGIGLAIALNKSIIMDYYDEQKQIKYLGYTTILASAGTIFFQTLIGHLSTIATNYMFLGYLPIIVTLILSFFIPDIPLRNRIETTKTKNKNTKLLYFSIIFLVLNMLMTCFTINFSTLLSTKSFGNSTIITVNATNIMSVFSIISGLLFNHIYSRYKYQFFPISLVLSAISMIFYILTTDVIVIYITSIIIGFSYNIIVIYIFLLASKTNKDNATVGGYIGLAAGIGGFASSFTLYLFEFLFQEAIYSILITTAITFLILALASIKYFVKPSSNEI